MAAWVETLRSAMAKRKTVAAWQFDSIVAYYAFNESCLDVLPKRLAALSDSDRATALDAVRSTINTLVHAVPVELVPRLAVSMVDDLYKGAANLEQWDEPTAEYVEAVYTTAFQAIAAHHYTVHYIVDNTYPDGLQRPLDFYPLIFAAAGFIYVCPHALALQLPEASAVEHTIDGLSPFIDEGRDIANQLMQEATQRQRSVVYLEIDFVAGCLDFAMSFGGSNGVIGVLRNEEPIAGSNVNVQFPQ